MRVQLRNGNTVDILNMGQLMDGIFSVEIQYTYSGLTESLLVDSEGYTAEQREGYDFTYETMDKINNFMLDK